MYYFRIIVKLLKVIIVIKDYANTCHPTNLTLQKLQKHEEVLKSDTLMHTFPKAFPAHGFVTVASSIATGPFRSEPAAVRDL